MADLAVGGVCRTVIDSRANFVLPVIACIYCFVEHFPLRFTVKPLYPNIRAIVLFTAIHAGD